MKNPRRLKASDLIEQKLLMIGDGYRAKNDELSNEGLPFARAGNINNGFHFKKADRFPEGRLSIVGNKLSQAGDVVFTSKGTVGRFAFVTADVEQFVYSPQLCFWRALDHDVIDPQFLYYWMNGFDFYEQFKGVSGQTDMAEYVSLTDQRKMMITLPDIAVQRSIGISLASLDQKIEINKLINTNFKALTHAIFKDWFIDFGPTRAKMAGRAPYLEPEIWSLFPNELDDNGQPVGWSQSSIGDEIEIAGGSTPSTTVPEYWGGEIAWATPKDLSSLPAPVLLSTERRITAEGLTQIGSGLLPAGTVLLSSRAPIGYLAVTQIPCAINQGFIAMRCNKRVSKHFAWPWTNAHMDVIKQKANGSTFQEISKSSFRTIPILLPTDALLTAFDAVIAPLFEQIVSNEQESRDLAETRDFLLPKLMSGELRVDNNTV